VTTPKGYWIAHVTITNTNEHLQCLKAAQPACEKYRANFIVRGGKYNPVGGASRERRVVTKFESYEQDVECCGSPEYQEAAKIRRAHSTGDILIVEGAP